MFKIMGILIVSIRTIHTHVHTYIHMLKEYIVSVNMYNYHMSAKNKIGIQWHAPALLATCEVLLKLRILRPAWITQ